MFIASALTALLFASSALLTEGRHKREKRISRNSVTYTAIGCYSDNTSGRALGAVNYTDSSSMTIERCLAIGALHNSTYVGVEYAGECWYGQSLSSTSTAIASSKCNMACKGNSAEICGGANALTLFKASTARVTSSSSSSAATTSTTTTKASSPATFRVISTSKTSSSSSTATSATSSLTLKAGKKGIAYNALDLLNVFSNTGKITWAYNWGSSAGGTVSKGVEYIPMLWTASENDAAGLAAWKEAAQTAINNGASALLGFNEPDMASQANLDPKTAATLWKAYMEPFADQVLLISPAVTNGNGMDAKGKFYGIDWLLQFYAACTGCHIHASACHWYETATNTGYFETHFTNVSTLTKRPIWATEFYVTSGDASAAGFFDVVVPWLDKSTFVERYSAFGAFNSGFGKLIDGSTLNAGGSAYITPS